MTDAPKPEGIPPNVKLFLRSHIDSVGLLEILLLLHETDDREWSADDVNLRLQSSLSSVQNRLGKLESHGLISVSAAKGTRVYRYSPRTEEVAKAVTDLAATYKNYRIRVIDFVFSPPDQLKDFSDSFRFREDKEKP